MPESVKQAFVDSDFSEFLKVLFPSAGGSSAIDRHAGLDDYRAMTAFHALNAFWAGDTCRGSVESGPIECHRQWMTGDRFQLANYVYVLDETSEELRRGVSRAVDRLLGFYGNVCRSVGMSVADAKVRIKFCRGTFDRHTFFVGSRSEIPFGIVEAIADESQGPSEFRLHDARGKEAKCRKLLDRFSTQRAASGIQLQLSDLFRRVGESLVAESKERVWEIVQQVFDTLGSVPLEKTFCLTSLSPTLRANEASKSAGTTVKHKFGFGQSAFSPPQRVRSKLSEAATKTELRGYPVVEGIGELRDAITRYWSRSYHCPESSLAMVGPGSKSLLHAVQRVVEGPIMFPVPSWVSYAPQARFVSSEVVWVTTKAENGFFPSYEELRQAYDNRHLSRRPTKLLINSPNNPTGQVANAQQREEIIRFCRQHDVLLLSDEIYADFVFEAEHVSLASLLPEKTIVFSGLSKNLGIGGWRFGFALVPQALGSVFQALRSYASDTWSGVATPIQYAALESFNGDDAAFRRAQAEAQFAVMKYIHEGVQPLCDVRAPQGAFYLYPRLKTSPKGLTSVALCDHLAQHGIAVLPATSFGDHDSLSFRIAASDFDGERLTQAVLSGSVPGDFRPLVEHHCPAITAATHSLASVLGQLTDAN